MVCATPGRLGAAWTAAGLAGGSRTSTTTRSPRRTTRSRAPGATVTVAMSPPPVTAAMFRAAPRASGTSPAPGKCRTTALPERWLVYDGGFENSNTIRPNPSWLPSRTSTDCAATGDAASSGNRARTHLIQDLQAEYRSLPGSSRRKGVGDRLPRSWAERDVRRPGFPRRRPEGSPPPWSPRV